ALQVDVMLAAHVDGDAVDRADGEAPGHLTRVIGGDAGTVVAPHAESLAGDHEFSRLSLDRTLADLRVAVPEREETGGDAGRVLAALVERGRQDQVLPGRDVRGRLDILLCH